MRRTTTQGWVLCLSALVVGLTLSPSSGQEPAAEKPSRPHEPKLEYVPPAWPKATSEAALLGRLAVVTLLTLAVAVGVLVWVKRATRLPSPPPGMPPPVKVAASIALGSGCSLYLIEVERSAFVVGSDRTGLKAIQHVAEPFEQILEVDLAPTRLDSPEL